MTKANFWVCTSCKTSYDVLHNQVQKVSIPYHGRLFRNSEGILQLEIKRDGEYFMIGIFKRCGGWGGVLHCRSRISQGSVKSVFLENAYFMALIRSQIKQKLTTLSWQPWKQNKTSPPHKFFFSHQSSLINYFVHSVFSMWNMVFWLMGIIEAYGIGSNCWPQRLKFKMMKWKCTWS